jgi:DNA-binding beta-propeller fold protein YncE
LRTAAILLGTVSLVSAAEDKAAKPVHAKGEHATQPARGIRTPGIQIPVSELKDEAKVAVPSKLDWIFVSDFVFSPAASALNRIEIKTNTPAPEIGGLARPCGGMTTGFDSLWVPLCGDGSLVKLDSKSFKVSARIPTGAASVPGIVAASPDSLWVLADEKTTLSRIDPVQNTVVAEIRLPAGCRNLLFSEAALWVACPGENKVLRINPATNLVEKRIEVSENPVALAGGEGSIWAYCRKNGKVDRIDPKTNKVSKSVDIGLPNSDAEIAVGEGSVWVSSTGYPITRIDPKTEAVTQQFYGEGGGVIALSKGAVWLANDGTVSRIDPRLIELTLSQ